MCQAECVILLSSSITSTHRQDKATSSQVQPLSGAITTTVSPTSAGKTTRCGPTRYCSTANCFIYLHGQWSKQNHLPLSNYQSIYLCIYLSIYPSVCLSVCLSVVSVCVIAANIVCEVNPLKAACLWSERTLLVTIGVLESA